MLRKIRITLAAVFFIGLTLLFLDFTGTLHAWLGWMAKVQFWPAVLALNVVVIVALVALTLVFGRIYCSVICPLGVMQDLFGWIGKKAKKNRYTYSKEMKWLRYPMLAIFIVALLAGVGSIFQLLEPYSAFGRIATMLLQPLWQMGNNVLASMAEHYDSYAFYSVDVWMRSMPVFIVALVTLAVLIVLAWRGGRTYCNTICPVGTVLSLIARFSFYKIRIDTSKCKNCSLCARNCKASCIDFKNHKVDYSRCVVCGDCIESCHSGALSLSRPSPQPLQTHPRPLPTGRGVDTSSVEETDIQCNYSPPSQGGARGGSEGSGGSPSSSRRSFLLATALATTAALAQEKKKVDGGLAEIVGKKAPERQTPLVPPGAQSLKNMAQRCTGCQLCVSECPNHVLRPELLTSASSLLTGFMQPVMDFDRGYCRPECTRCSDVCPTGAIKPLDEVEKSAIQIGHAVVSADHCISALGEAECGNCARHCPANAIEMVPTDPDDDLSPSVPAINEEACIGCGACEYLCPVRPFSAIHVEGHEVHRNI